MAARKRARVLIPANEDEFCRLGGVIMDRDPEGKSETIFLRRWMSFFGVEPDVVTKAWSLLHVAVEDPDDPEMNGAKPEHILWGLLFLKKYGDETEMARLASCQDEGTFRKWSELFVKRLSYLVFEVVSTLCFVTGSRDIGNADYAFVSIVSLCRFVGRIASKMTAAMIVLFLLIAQISECSINNCAYRVSGPSSSSLAGFDTKLQFAY